VETKFLKFPDKFFWGSATSAHQIEGDNYNDWSLWEISKDRVNHLRERGKNPVDFISGKASDSYNRYHEDFDIAKKLNHNIHRFSIEWSRIEPEEGRFDHDAMQHYIDIVKALQDRGIEPMITLWHFTNPIWFSVKGGFLNDRSPELYKRFISYVVENLKDRVGLWITFNEATTVYASLVHLKGAWLSQKKGIFKFIKFRKNIIRAHTLAYREIKNIYRSWPEPSKTERENAMSHNSSSATSVTSQKTTPLCDINGMSHNGVPLVGSAEFNFYPITKKWMMEHLKVGKIFDYLANNYFWLKTLPYQDFLGLNYYTVYRLPGSYSALKKQDIIPEMGWEIYPEGIYHRLIELKRFNKPIFITENGIADATDKKRSNFIKDHLFWIHKAIQGGTDVKGYLHWSLLDNFEWALGFNPRFGLVKVNYKTFEREIRPSAFDYAKIIEENGLEHT
jgi:beta-glucosidase